MDADPLRLFLGQRATASRLLYTSDDVQATLYNLQDGIQAVLKVTSPGRADFEWVQVSNEVKAARSLPNCSCLGHQVAWKEAPDGSMMCVSLYAGRTVEALLQEPAARGGWADLNLQQRVEVAREVLAGGLHALSKLRPWLHFDVKPANVAVMPCPANGPAHITLLDMGALSHIAALHTPDRASLYPVVSRDHMDVNLITRQPGQVQLPYESKQGCRGALSDKTDIFTLGLLAYKILLGPQLPPELDWNSSLYDPWGTLEELQYVACQQRLARDLSRGASTHPSTQALLQQLPPECIQALGRLCDPDPASRAHLEEAVALPFIQQPLARLAAFSAARDAAYSAARQQLINLLQDIPDIKLAARPSRASRHSSSDISWGSRVSSSGNLQPQCVEEPPPPGAFQRLPRGTNAAREAAAAAKAAAARAGAGSQYQGSSIRQQQQEQQQHAAQGSAPPGFTCRLAVPRAGAVPCSVGGTCGPGNEADSQQFRGYSAGAIQQQDEQQQQGGAQGPPGFFVKHHVGWETAHNAHGKGTSRFHNPELPQSASSIMCHPPGFKAPQHHQQASLDDQQHHHHQRPQQPEGDWVGSHPPGFDTRQRRGSHERQHFEQPHGTQRRSGPQHQLSDGCPPPGSWPRQLKHLPSCGSSSGSGSHQPEAPMQPIKVQACW